MPAARARPQMLAYAKPSVALATAASAAVCVAQPAIAQDVFQEALAPLSSEHRILALGVALSLLSVVGAVIVRETAAPVKEAPENAPKADAAHRDAPLGASPSLDAWREIADPGQVDELRARLAALADRQRRRNAPPLRLADAFAPETGSAAKAPRQTTRDARDPDAAIWRGLERHIAPFPASNTQAAPVTPAASVTAPEAATTQDTAPQARPDAAPAAQPRRAGPSEVPAQLAASTRFAARMAGLRARAPRDPG